MRRAADDETAVNGDAVTESATKRITCKHHVQTSNRPDASAVRDDGALLRP